jgi:hypothetical protein
MGAEKRITAPAEISSSTEPGSSCCLRQDALTRPHGFGIAAGPPAPRTNEVAIGN